MDSQKGSFPNPIERFRKIIQRVDWGLSVSVTGYLMLMFIGMCFSFCYYAHFKINIFRFSEISDFLLIPFADPFTIIFTLASLGLVLGLAYVIEYWKWKSFESFSKWERILSFGLVKRSVEAHSLRKKDTSYAIAILLYVLTAALRYGTHKADQVINNTTFIEYSVNIAGDLPAKDSLLFVGENSSYYFLYHKSEKTSIVLPKDKVNYVKIRRNKNGRIY